MLRKYTRVGLNVKNNLFVEKACIRYQLLVSLGVKYVNAYMLPYIEFSRKSNHFFNFEKFFIGLIEFSIFFNTLLSANKNLRILFVSLLNENSVSFIADMALKNKMFFSLGYWPSGLLTNFIKTGNCVKKQSDLSVFNRSFVTEVPDLLFLFNTHGGNQVLNEALKCAIPVVSVSSAVSDPRVTVNLPGDGGSPLVCYTYSRFIELFLEQHKNTGYIHDITKYFQDIVSNNYNNKSNVVLKTKKTSKVVSTTTPIIKKYKTFWLKSLFQNKRFVLFKYNYLNNKVLNLFLSRNLNYLRLVPKKYRKAKSNINKSILKIEASLKERRFNNKKLRLSQLKKLKNKVKFKTSKVSLNKVTNIKASTNKTLKK